MPETECCHLVVLLTHLFLRSARLSSLRPMSANLTMPHRNVALNDAISKHNFAGLLASHCMHLAQIHMCPSAILALQNVQGTLECYSKLKDKLGLKTGR